MKRLLFIVNPCSGQKKAKKYLLDIIELFNRAGYGVTVHVTAGSGDGEAAVLLYGADHERIVCCGGDGTFNEVVSAVMKGGYDMPIGYIPAGSTNDFANSMGLAGDIMKAAEAAVGEEARAIDAGLFGSRYFSYVASFGAFTRTSYSTPQSMKNVLGHAAYVLSGIQELSQLKPYRLRFETAERQVIEDDFIFGAISNSTSVGGILNLAPELVDMSDGLFELLLLRYPKDLAELADCVRALQQKTYDCDMLRFLSTSAVRVAASADMHWTIDGEHEPGHEQIEIRCLKQAIKVVCG